jgi:predicted RNA-binding protein YlqC (UPF0109 family)
MSELLKFILEKLIGDSDFEIEEAPENENFVRLTAHLNAKDMGLIIGKEGATIKSIRNILRIKAILAKQAFSFNVVEKAI